MSNQTSVTSPTSEAIAPATTWIPVAGLASGTTVLVTSEFLPAGVLPKMAADIGVSDGVAGLAVGVTAIAGAVTAPTIALVLPRIDRRTVLVALLAAGCWLLAAGALANLAVSIAPNFVVLLLGRLLLGIALAGFWSFAFGAGLTVAPGRPSVVSTALAFGVSLSTVLGVPLAALVGNDVGWRAAFGNFAGYPYIRLAIERVSSAHTTWLLVVWGVGGIAGNLIAGALAARLRLLAASAPVLLGVGLLVTAAAHSVVPLAIGIVLWGFAFNMVPVATQLWVTRVESDRVESAVSLQVTAFQVAITVGATAGGALLDARGVQSPLVIGAATALAAGLGFGLLRLPRG